MKTKRPASEANKLFKQIMVVFVNIAGKAFSYELRGRLAKVLMSQGLTSSDTVVIASCVAEAAQKRALEGLPNLSDAQWVGYAINAAKDKLEHKLSLFAPHMAQFKAADGGITMAFETLGEYEYGLYLDYLELKQLGSVKEVETKEWQYQMM